jgi:hypothetical protein
MAKPKKSKRAAETTRQTIYANVPADLAARIRARVEEMGYPHTMASVVAHALAEQFPAPAAPAGETAEGKAP